MSMDSYSFFALAATTEENGGGILPLQIIGAIVIIKPSFTHCDNSWGLSKRGYSLYGRYWGLIFL